MLDPVLSLRFRGLLHEESRYTNLVYARFRGLLQRQSPPVRQSLGGSRGGVPLSENGSGRLDAQPSL